MTKLNACHNRVPLRESMTVQDGWTSATLTPDAAPGTRRPRMVAVPFRMAPDCRYTLTDLGAADKGCLGCRWRSEETQTV